MDNILYSIQNLKCSYNHKRIVLEINNLDIPQGKVIFFVGSSGIGKSTILETLGLMNNTLLSAERFDYQGKSLLNAWTWSDAKKSQFRNKEFSFIFQQNNLMPNFTAHDNIITAALFQGEEEQSALQRMQKILDDLKLPTEDRKIQEFSGGQLQRIAFARAILPKFTVLFGDEPTGNLDTHTARNLIEILINEVHQHKRTAIIVSHDISLSVEYADMIIQIRKFKTKADVHGYIDENCIYSRIGNRWINTNQSYESEQLKNQLISNL